MKLVVFLFILGAAASKKSCPKLKCGVNEYPVPCKTLCPPQNCDIAYTEYLCDPEKKCIPGCDCIKNHLRNDKGICIYNDECPGLPTVDVVPPQPTENPSGSQPTANGNAQSTSTSTSSTSTSSASSSASSFSSSQSSASSYASSHSSHNGTGAPGLKCGVNEYAVPCKTICPPQDCAIAYTSYACDPKQKCIPGCDCIKDYLRNNEKICVFNENCPPPQEPSDRPQEEPSDVPPQQPNNPSGSGNTKTTSQSTNSASATSFSSSSTSRSSSQSFASSQSSSHSSSHGTGGGGKKRACTYDRCTPTCSLPYPQNCPGDSNPCNCPPGTIISEEGGECVQREECQKYANCKGDYNATYTDCPIACPSTCSKPNAEYCNTQCGNLGCACDPGYLLTEINGKCIKPEDCPGGNACGKNEVFVGCLIGCPTSYCPVDDNRGILICDPAYPCPSGCGCKRNYLRKSYSEKECIPASECPPVECTRPNEEWNPCPGPCFSDNCSERNKATGSDGCVSSGPDCRPQCVCKQGFYRNGTDICVTPQECN